MRLMTWLRCGVLLLTLLLFAGTGILPAVSAMGSPLGKTLATFPASVGAVAVDQRGTVYLAESSIVVAMPAAGGPLRTVWKGAATDLTVDPSGNLFILDGGCNCVVELQGGHGHGVVVFSGADIPSNVVFATLSGIAVDGSDTLYAVGGTGAMIYIKHPHVTPASYTQALYAIDSFMAQSIVVDGAGNLFVADDYVGAIAELHATTHAVERFTTAATSFANRPGLAIDHAGNLYVAGDRTNSVIEIVAVTHQQRTIATGLNGPLYVAADTADHVYISDTGNTRFVKVDLRTGHVATIGWPLAHPSSIAEDAAGNLYIADMGNSRVVKLPARGGAWVTLGHGFSSPSSVAVDARGRIVVADPGSNRVVALDLASGRQTNLAATTNLQDPVSVATDQRGYVYIADRNNDRVLKVTADGVSGTPVSSGWIYPQQVAADAAGDVFVVMGANGTLYKVAAKHNTRVLLNGGQPIPAYMTADARGNVYFDDGHSHIVRVQPDGTTRITASASFLQGPYFVDAAGNLFVVTPSAIVEYAAASLAFHSV